MLIGIPVESRSHESRVALTPDAVSGLVAKGHVVVVEAGAGRRAGFTDDRYVAAGARLDDSAWQADLVAVVSAPDDAPSRMRSGAALIGFLQPLERPGFIERCASSGITALAFELLPRTTLAQSMDALSSQASLAGYAAVLLAADHSGHILPMMTTAAGTLRPSSTLVLGAGVAGLQAIATAKRLGSVVSAFDVREVVEEQVKSLGGKFIRLDLAADAATDGGYAKALLQDEQARIIRGLEPHVVKAQVIITTAQIPGRRAPILIDDQTLDACSPGTVIVDLAASTGGNTTATVAGEEVDRDGVLIVGPHDLSTRVATDASSLYARNVSSLLAHLCDGADLSLDFTDEIADGVAVTHGGVVRSARVASLIQSQGSPE